MTMCAWIALVVAIISTTGTLAYVMRVIRASGKTGALLDKRNPTNHSLWVTRRQVVSQSNGHHVVQLSMALPTGVHLGLAVGKHIKLSAPCDFGFKPVIPGEWNGRIDTESVPITRSYTPVSEKDAREVRLLVKVYDGGDADMSFPDGGKLGKYIDTLREGDPIHFSGPFGVHEYVAPGTFTTGRRRLSGIQNIALIGAGSGITPLYSLINEVLNNPADRTRLWLVYANRSEGDIILREQLDALARVHKDRFSVWYTLDGPYEDDSWAYSNGPVGQPMLSAHTPPPAADAIATICGPPGFCKYACHDNLKALGWSAQSIITF